MIKTVIFDFDGVLVESLDIKTSAFGKLFEDGGRDFSEKVVRYHIDNSGVSRYEKIRFIYKEMLKRDLDEETFVRLCNKFSDLVAEEVIKAAYVPGALDFLEKHVSDYSFYICSATPVEELKKIIKERDMYKFFKKIYGSPSSKKDIVKEILSECGLEGTEAVYVGDALSDYNAARENGVNFVGRGTEDKKDIFKEKACPVVCDLKGLQEVIERYFTGEESDMCSCNG